MDGLHLGERVHFAGFRRDTKAVLAASDLFVFPSLQEGLPCAVQEALSMEVPVLCFSIRGCTDMVDSNCGAILNHLQSCRTMTNKMVDLLRLSVAQRKALGCAGRQKMIEHYSRPVCVAEWLEIYNKISPSPNPSSQGWEEGAGGRRAS